MDPIILAMDMDISYGYLKKEIKDRPLWRKSKVDTNLMAYNQSIYVCVCQ